ncbi:methylated-DNA--[protein]-cysteine S-methyltransferase [Secundilactobacillus kimchicus]|uniref:methylated-DNA--[protein]-cysteine S-methyltransferase n=1 Tax=Secundilactobacillus kimchicus TaxID=528209 RepID=UPI000AFEE1FE|nr:methylated-DNA--[protein]-cysteine S-methyltransferase [Secundilactobacillus kimchicus]
MRQRLGPRVNALFFKTATVRQEATVLIEQAVQQLREYRAGQRQHFDVATMVLAATPFQRQVWRTLTHIPYGQTVSYQQLAAKMNRPSAVRAVASAVAKNPLMEIVACHRVILSTGQTGQYRGGATMKARLLAMEKKSVNWGKTDGHDSRHCGASSRISFNCVPGFKQ